MGSLEEASQGSRLAGLFSAKSSLKSSTTGEMSAQFPQPMPAYARRAVPEKIAAEFQEALRCAPHGFRYGTAIVARRALQAAYHEVRYIGNDAAHCDEVTESDVAVLLEFTKRILDKH